jgi:hypothetical protein
MSVPAPADRRAPAHPARVQRAACSRGSSPLASRWCSWWLPSGFGKTRQLQQGGHHDRRAGYLAPLTLLAYSRRAGCPGTPDPGWDVFRAGAAVVTRTPDWLPQGKAGALERVLRGIAGSSRSHGRAGPGVARPLANRPAGEDPGAIADKTLSWKRCLANRADDVAAQDHPRTPPRAVRNQRACRHARASHADAAAHRAVITITADHPARGDARVVRTTAWCGTV